MSAETRMRVLELIAQQLKVTPPAEVLETAKLFAGWVEEAETDEPPAGGGL